MSDTLYPVLIATSDHEIRTVEFTRVTELLDNPWDFENVGRQLIEEIKELEPSDPVIVVSFHSITPEGEAREEIDYRIEILITPRDVKLLEDSPILVWKKS